ncbi:MAG: type II toxin-antitoxin system HicB family antitoxin [Candidatus Lokiarchaeota archaeon]|nr:type II toxin-antitoxin system HicB family antitoxin [Candidatus Lokiarchaeota archaeon]
MAKQKYIVVIEQDEDGIYIGSVPALKGCHSQGDTLDELLENMKEAIEAHLEYLKHTRDEVPADRFNGISEIEIEVAE